MTIKNIKCTYLLDAGGVSVGMHGLASLLPTQLVTIETTETDTSCCQAVQADDTSHSTLVGLRVSKSTLYLFLHHFSLISLQLFLQISDFLISISQAGHRSICTKRSQITGKSNTINLLIHLL